MVPENASAKCSRMSPVDHFPSGRQASTAALAEVIGEAPVSGKAKGAAQMEPWSA